MSATKPEPIKNETDAPVVEKLEERSAIVVWSSFGFVVLQSVCTALIAASGFRTLIGAGALALSSTNLLVRFHQSEIRDPMLLLATLGAVLDLIILWQVRRLRKRPASRWRQMPPSPRKLRMERIQFAFSIVTLVLVCVELLAHQHLHGAVLTALPLRIF